MRTLLQESKIHEVGVELARSKIKLAALQEVKWKVSGINVLIYSGSQNQEHQGVTFMVPQKPGQQIVETREIDKRTNYITFNKEPYMNPYPKCIYSYRDCKLEEKNKFSDEVKEVLISIPKEDMIILPTDLNVRISMEEYPKDLARKFTIHAMTIDNGYRPGDLAARRATIISSAKHKHPRKHKITWNPQTRKQNHRGSMC